MIMEDIVLQQTKKEEEEEIKSDLVTNISPLQASTAKEQISDEDGIGKASELSSNVDAKDVQQVERSDHPCDENVCPNADVMNVGDILSDSSKPAVTIDVFSVKTETPQEEEKEKNKVIGEENIVDALQSGEAEITQPPAIIEPTEENLTTKVDNNVDPEKEKKGDVSPSVSLRDYLYGEIRRGYLLENDEQRYTERRKKFYIFFKIPREIEKFILYGFFQCVDAFLFLFTFLPLRCVLSLWFLISRSTRLVALTLFSSQRVSSRLLQPAEICDLLKGSIVITVSFMMTYIDTSMMYHIVKSQSVIKLYIMFNMLEVADKLFSSFGQDILDALYWTATEPRGRKREHIGLIPHIVLSVAYVFAHAIIVLLQATTLNVAINSQNKALLTIMLSNNFVELKSMVFKKFEKNNLFQMACSDVRERFHYLILLFIVIIQTMKEYSWNYEQFVILFPYCIGVIGAEILVDWTKHAFVTRFNEISFEVYRDYRVSLAYDLVSCKLKNAFSDHSDLISRRMGLIPLPLAALVLRVVIGSVPFEGLFGCISLFLVYLCLGSAKLWISIALLGKACQEIELHRSLQRDKYMPPRQCNSLPSSRHHSTEDLRANYAKPKSMPQSQCASMSSSLADLAAQVELHKDIVEQSPLFANSTVSLDNLGGINDGTFVAEQFLPDKLDHGEKWKATATFGGVTRPHPPEAVKRRTSLQEEHMNGAAAI